MLSMFHTVSHGFCHEILPNDIQVQNDIETLDTWPSWTECDFNFYSNLSESTCTCNVFIYISILSFIWTLHCAWFLRNFSCSKWRLLLKHLLAALNLPLGTTSLYNNYYFMNYLLIISSLMNVSGQRFIKCMLLSSLFFFLLLLEFKFYSSVCQSQYNTHLFYILLIPCFEGGVWFRGVWLWWLQLSRQHCITS